MQMIPAHLHDHSFPIPPPSFSQTTIPQPTSKKKRNLPGTPDPDAEVIALSPESLMATNRFVCEICNKGFQRDQNLQLHRRGHNLPWKLRQRSSKEAVRKKVYICPDTACVHHHPSRALGDLTGIKKHFSRKHGDKKWKCDKCSKKYAVKSDWKAHSKTCGTRQYKCDCGTLFSRKDSFITHRAFCDALLLSVSVSTNTNDVDFKTNTSTVTINPPQAGGTLSNLGSDLPMAMAWRNEAPHHMNPTVQIASSSPMSATALLQKAALMGSTSSSSMLGAGCGLMRWSNATIITGSDSDSPSNSNMGMGMGRQCDQSISTNELQVMTAVPNGGVTTTRDFLGVHGPFLPNFATPPFPHHFHFHPNN